MTQDLTKDRVPNPPHAAAMPFNALLRAAGSTPSPVAGVAAAQSSRPKWDEVMLQHRREDCVPECACDCTVDRDDIGALD